MMTDLQIFTQGVQYIKGVGPRRQLVLQKQGISTLFDLLWHIPRQYEDMSQLKTPEEMAESEVVFCEAEVLQVTKNRIPRGMVIVRAKILCGGSLMTAVWFNQPYVATQLKENETLFIKGRVKRAGPGGEIHVLHYEKPGLTEQGLLPVYPLAEGLNQKSMRQSLQTLLETYLPRYPEILPENLRQREGLMTIQAAFQNIHFPADAAHQRQAHRRLALEEYLLFRFIMMQNPHTEKLPQQFPPLDEAEEVRLMQIRDRLPFRLTAAQDRVIKEIRQDMLAPYAMNRLLEGDVGSGKTLVAALTMLISKARGTQSAFMAPTEILALQHFHSLQKLYGGLPVVMACLTSSTPPKERTAILEALAAGELDILVGTHALIQEDLNYRQLGLVIIDEQHRFGVRQRARLSEKGLHPDVLVMTATPIPRTLALSLNGQLAISVLDELPPGRLPVKTKYLPRKDRRQAYAFAARRILAGEQAYVICPLVEESEKQSLLDVHTLYEELQTIYGGTFSIGMVHGRMSGEEKQQGLEDFAAGKIKMLIATTVVEVGVDVPTATVMIVEHAERFGLSQLHQLRGRVGRGKQQSYCILLGEPAGDTAYQRLLAMQQTNDGFALANLDLKLRGPGDFWGFRQHGLNDLKVLDLSQDQDIVACGEKILPEVAAGLNPGLREAYLALKFPQLEEIASN